MEKTHKSLDEQIALLRSRGLLIEDENAAKKFLLQNNYYRISGYSLTLRSHDVFHKNVSLQNIIDIYFFDHSFRHILLKYIEMIEVSFKSVYSYEFTKRYGATAYLSADCFRDEATHTRIIGKAEEQKNARLPHEAYLKHFIEEEQQLIPFWAYVDLLTISDISILYSISDFELQVAVAEDFAIVHQGAEIMKKFMHSMTIIRNLCAHGSRLFNRLFHQKPWLSKKELSLLRKNDDGSVDNAHLFGFILIMRRLLNAEDFLEMKSAILMLSQKYPFVDMKYYGFCENWKEVL